MPPPLTEKKTSSRSVHLPEFDLFRSIAATLMVINHVAVHAVGLGNLWGVPEFAFVGSFAPVFFFFLTGIGFGVQSGTRPAPQGHGYIVKVLILFAADAMLWVSPERYVGLDFFGFIGLSMLCLEWLRRAPRSGLLAGTLASLVVTARFALGSTLKNWLASAGVSWLGAALGAHSVPGVSYPPCPWLAYPFIGYALGRLAAGGIDPVGVRRPFVLALSFAGSTLIPRAAKALNSPLSRRFAWAVVSIGFVITYSLLVMDKLGERSGLTFRTFIQLGLCVVLGVSRRPSPANSSEIQRGRHRNDAALPSAAASSSAP